MHAGVRDADRTTLVLHLRAARSRARELAIAEVTALLSGAGAKVEAGGPLADQGGIAWVSVDPGRRLDVEPRLWQLGYVDAVDLVEPAAPQDRGAMRWQRRWWVLRRIYEDDPEDLRNRSPDRRDFVLGTGGGARSVRGYRGSGHSLERRGLPVVDARLLVNLASHGRSGCRVLDPFAGAGGIVVAGRDAGHVVFSADLDPRVSAGLLVLTGGRHAVADVRALPLRRGGLDAIATETPFEPAADETLAALLQESRRLLRPGGLVAVMCGERQAPRLRTPAPGLEPVLDHAVDRKGLATRVLVWRRS